MEFPIQDRKTYIKAIITFITLVSFVSLVAIVSDVAGEPRRPSPQRRRKHPYATWNPNHRFVVDHSHHEAWRA
jgi:hypothetical protein